MKTLPLIAAGAALLALGACKQETVIAGDHDDMKEAVAAAPKVVLPPSVKSSKAYRCKDNSIVYIDFFQGDKTANLRAAKDAPPTQLTAAEAGQPLVAEGYSVSGSGSTVTVMRPGKGSQACKG
jgi:hypothetical protein